MADNEPRIREVPTGLVLDVGSLDKRVVTGASDYVTSSAAGEWGWDQTPAVDEPLPTTRLPNSRSNCTSRAAGKMATTSKIGCVPRSCSGVTRNCEVPRNRRPTTSASPGKKPAAPSSLFPA